MAEGDNRYRRDVTPTSTAAGQQRSSQNIVVNVGGTSSSSATTAQIATWARVSNTDTIPEAKIPVLSADKLVNAPTGSGGGLTTVQARALILEWARTGNTDEIPIAKIPKLDADKLPDEIPVGNLPTAATEGLNTSEVDDRILIWARKDNTQTIPDNKLPTSATEGLNTSEVTALIATWARVNSPSGTVPTARLPRVSTSVTTQLGITSIGAIDGRIAPWARFGQTAPTSDSGLNTAEATALIATWARVNSPSGTVPTARLPRASTSSTSATGIISVSTVDGRIAPWARFGQTAPSPDSGLNTSQVTALIATWARTSSPSGTVPTARLPQASTASTSTAGIISVATVDGRIESWARPGTTGTIPNARLPNVTAERLPTIPVGKLPVAATEGLNTSEVTALISTWARATSPSGTVPIARLPVASTARTTEQGIVSIGVVDSRIASFARAGQPAPTGGLTTSQVDARIATWARTTSPTGTVPTARLPKISTTVSSQQGIIALQDVDNRIQLGVLDWAEAGNTSKIPAAKLPDGEDAATWAEAGNTDPIPPNKLSNILDPTNNVNVLRDVSTSGTVNFIDLPSDYNTKYRYLLVGGHANSEYGILDTQYLAAHATLRSETYNWTRDGANPRRLSGLVKGAYLYGFDADNILSKDGWLRATMTTTAPIVPTTSANDGVEGIDATREEVNKYPFFASRVFDPGTLQFIPNQFYKDIAIGSNRVFRVHDENLTKTVKVTRDSADGWSFDSFNQQANRDINDMRSIAFLNFHQVEDITPATSVNTMILPSGFGEKDFFVAVTKNTADAYWTVWTLKPKFPAYTPRLAPGGSFTPGATILYAALITAHGELEIKATDVSVDDDSFSNITGENVQTALASVDTQLGGGSVTSTPNRGTTFPTTGVVNGDEFNLTAAVAENGPDITPAQFSNTFLDGQGWGTFGFANYGDSDGGTWALGHSTEALPEDVLIISNKNVVVADGTNTDFLAIVLESPEGTKVARRLTRSDQTNKDIDGGPNPVHVDSYTYNADLPSGTWHNVYFLRTGGTGCIRDYSCQC